MLQSKQIPLKEWFGLAKSLFWHKQTLRGSLSKVWISEVYLEPSRKSLMKFFPENTFGT